MAPAVSSDLESILRTLQMNDYVGFAVVTIVLYDYFLLFPKEIGYVWLKPWTWVSTIFVLVRYVGLSMVIICGLVDSSFVPGSYSIWIGACIDNHFVVVSTSINYIPQFYWTYKYAKGAMISLVMNWEYQLFFTAADWIMILRVHAMWHRSKTILYVLLFVYVPQTITSLVLTGIRYNPNTYLSVTVIQVTNKLSFCSYSLRGLPPALDIWIWLPRFILSTILLVLAVAQTLKQSADMYGATKQWKPNRYMRLLVRDGTFYFLLGMLYNVVHLLAPSATHNTWSLFLCSWDYTAMSVIMPRFIIGVRELYDRDLQQRWQGIDSGFGVFSQPVPDHHSAILGAESADVSPAQHPIMEGDVDQREGIQGSMNGEGISLQV